ncbi:hypothetical protein BpHYR1_037954 [Brachionus plicatilis]|uniref:Uncharacterized protein n=1 Tax=Brachionus plicatilis TaxID=10195 RepID=A0A3M7QDT5_BRAPC|nr:hypothetical protein BpHYR1_037954 [Brachionus plicatilis]
MFWTFLTITILNCLVKNSNQLYLNNCLLFKHQAYNLYCPYFDNSSDYQIQLPNDCFDFDFIVFNHKNIPVLQEDTFVNLSVYYIDLSSNQIESPGRSTVLVWWNA